MPRHPIRVVAQRTGLKPDLIRAWERRYRAIEPQRSAGRHRLYSDDDVERLILLRDATNAWRNIGQLAGLDNEALRRLASAERAPSPTPRGTTGETCERPIAAALEAIEQLDFQKLASTLEQAALEHEPSQLISRLLVPLVQTVGERWRQGLLRPMHEHLASEAIRSFLIALLAQRQPAAGAPALVVTTPAGQRHEIGALFVAATAVLEGWRVSYLGPDLPAADIAAVVQHVGAQGVALSIVYPQGDPKLPAELRELRRQLGGQIPILVGGQAAAAYAEHLESIAALHLADLGHLRSCLGRLRETEQPERGPMRAVPPPRPSEPRARTFVAEPHPVARPREAALELTISKRARERFELDGDLLGPDGRLHLPDLRAVRRAAHQINARRHLQRRPERTIRAGELNAVCLIQAVIRNLLGRWRAEHRPALLHDALERLYERFEPASVDLALCGFTELFSSTTTQPETRRNGAAPRQAELVLEEMFLVWLANRNPAFAGLRELFDDADLDTATGYRKLLESLTAAEGDVDDTPRADLGRLLDLLEAPVRTAPESLRGQLEALLRLKEELFGQVVDRLLTGLDVIKEEERAAFPTDGGGPPPEVLSFEQLGPAAPRRPEREWMPRVVMVAKNLPVWLDQLSRRAEREIARLDEIPDTALEKLAAWGFDTLWLIGLWRRSPASARIRELCGQPGAGASAYAVRSYAIAAELGGEAAFENLRRRAERLGLRLVGDVIPNHTAIDGDWVIEHPERFLSTAESPYPVYRFSGPDLSPDPRVGVFLEDHYYDRSDAAVVFKRVDRATGEERYLYHGNDGTGLPWNDTAQLDYLEPATREAMLQTLVAAARKFPVLRLDAAMTLIRQHVKRLWYPEPGQGGAIPSRAERSLAPGELERRMPREFWREAVERLAAEAPDTLLLAEGYWLMEATLLHTLGLDRVYNSAFLHMLRDEDNAGYRASIKNALAFDPEILARFANFLTTPDEPSAVEALGRGDKYFALATLLATLPGLLVFGHGQVEGLSERYGMHARRPRLDESVDRAMVARHEREIAPLLLRRALFAETEGFRLFDFTDEDGRVIDDVIAFTNRRGEERALVVVHNRNGRAHGFLRRSTPYRPRSRRAGDPRELRRASLREALGLDGKEGRALRFRDLVNGEEHRAPGRELGRRGLELELGAYEARVFGDFREEE